MPNQDSATDVENPFVRKIFGAWFVGRESELKRFRINLAGLEKQRPNHELVAGLEGAGKTYYLHKVAEIAGDEKYVAAVVPLDDKVSSYIQMRTVLAGC
jgi:signal recognition particle GTPase